VGEVVVVLLGERQSDGDLTTASRQDEEATDGQDEEARQSSTGDGAGDWVRLAINEIIHNGYARAELAGRQSYIATCYPDTAHFG
jgi:hypothetical protein